MESAPLLGDDTAAGDEAMLLRDALAFIGDLEGDDHDNELFSLFAEPLPAASTCSLDPSATPKECTIVATTVPLALLPASGSRDSKSKEKRPRTRRREELLYLRDLASELDSQLNQLKAKPKKADRGDKRSHPHSPTSELLLGAWKQIATRQYEQRQRSETENVKLKRLLEDQIQFGKSLERLMPPKRPKVETIGAHVHFGKSSERSCASRSCDDDLVFHALLASMASQYAETSRVLPYAEQCFRDPTTGRGIELVRDEALGIVLRATESHLLPFSHEVAVQAFWSMTPANLKNRLSSVHDVEVSDDLIKSQFRAHGTFGHMSGDLTVYIVDHRHREAERTVFLSAGVFDPTVIGDTNMNGVHMRHRGWTVFEPVLRQVDARATTEAVTKMTMYLLAAPEVVDDRLDRTHQVETLTAFMKLAMSSELEARHEAFENCLFALSL